MAKNTAHASLDRLRGKPIAKIEISASWYCSNSNPKGWGHPHYGKLEAEGFTCLHSHWQTMANAGYRVAAMWEPSGWYSGAVGMGWCNEKLLQSNWSDKMRLSWQKHLAWLRSIGMDPMWYLGKAPDHLDNIVEDLAFIRKAMGVAIVGLDNFEWLIETDIAKATEVISAIRSDERTKDMTLANEGMLLPSLTGPNRAFFLRHMAHFELARGSKGAKAIEDPNWKKLETAPSDRKLVKGAVHIVEMHGSEWQTGDLEACYAKTKRLGLVPCDHRTPIGAWQ